MDNIKLADFAEENGFLIPGDRQDSRFGDAVSSAGDVNGDGIADFIIGARDADVDDKNSAGKTYVIFGNEAGFNLDDSNSFNLDNLNGNNGFVLNGIDAEDFAGIAISNAGDVNNDGIDDLIIGARGADPNDNNNAGETYVVFGKEDEFEASFNLADLDGNNGFTINGIDEGDFSGTSVSNAGDINSDGIDDLIIGANFANSRTGETYVVFGKEDEFEASFNLADLNGNNGFTINGIDEGDFSGTSVSNAGDVNGDDIEDLIIGANSANSRTGETYIVFGKEDEFEASFNLADLDGSNGFTISGVDEGDNLGTSVSNAGDINGDGFSDLIVGAITANPNEQENAGEAYVIFGTDEEFSPNFDLSSLDGSNGFAINGAGVDNLLGTSVSGVGDVNGDRLDDIIVSAVGAEEETGTSYVLFGSKEEFPAAINLDELESSQGFTIEGRDGEDRSGNSVSGVGDVNSDGIADLLIGAPQADSNDLRDAGESYLIYGEGITFLGDVDGDSLFTNQDVYAISRVAVGLDSEFSAFPGIETNLIGDINNDGRISALDAALVASLIDEL